MKKKTNNIWIIAPALVLGLFYYVGATLVKPAVSDNTLIFIRVTALIASITILVYAILTNNE